MTLLTKEKSHTGEEWFRLLLKYEPEDMTSVRRVTGAGQIVPDTFTLVWKRSLGEPWKRVTGGTYGCLATGHVKVEGLAGARGPRQNREIFTRNLGELRGWAERLPGLRPAIEEAESRLPK
jgi:hypothetical protein